MQWTSTPDSDALIKVEWSLDLYNSKVNDFILIMKPFLNSDMNHNAEQSLLYSNKYNGD